MTDKKNNPLHSAQMQVKTAVEKLGLSEEVYELLKEPKRFIEIRIPVRMDNGEVKVFTGYRSQHNDAIGPFKGGLRFHPNVDADEVKALSLWMTMKCTITGIPYGGGKGGITVDPKKLSKRELEQLSRKYIRGLYHYLGEKLDVPAPDVNTNAQVMAWMVDEYTVLTGGQNIGVLTGKPLEFGGSQGRGAATGLGVAVVAREACKRLGFHLEDSKVAVQGFGNVGSHTVDHIQKLGGNVVAIAEWDEEHQDFAIYNENGFSFEELMKYKEEKGTLYGFPEAEMLTSKDFWSLPIDVLVPAALENAIDEEVAKTIQAKLICEGANGPTTAEADKVLEEKGIVVTPDILTNAGGVTVSYFEWAQNLSGYYWTEEEVVEKEKQAMMQAFENIWNMKEEQKVSMRQAAYLYSVKRVADSMKLRGWY